MVESIYEGGSRRWTVRLESGERVMVRGAQASDGTEAAHETAGCKVHISWDAAKSLIYPHESNPRGQDLPFPFSAPKR